MNKCTRGLHLAAGLGIGLSQGSSRATSLGTGLSSSIGQGSTTASLSPGISECLHGANTEQSRKNDIRHAHAGCEGICGQAIDAVLTNDGVRLCA